MRRSPVRRFAAAAGAAVVAAAVVAVTASTPAVGQPGGFGDVPEDAYYSVPVASLAELGVFVGTECDDGFCPGDPIDRKTMAVWTVRVLDGEDPAAVSESRFDDVDSDSFHAPFIERMAELEVTEGCGDGSGFCPDRSVTRAQMAAFLSRAYKLPEGPDPGFPDVPADAWYAVDVAKLAASKITVGCGDGTMFCPGRDTTRAQMATFLYRAENRSGTDQSSGADTGLSLPPMTFDSLSAGASHSCGVRTDGALVCWGANTANGLNAPDGTFDAVSAGSSHSCAVRTDATVACWGANPYGMSDSPGGSFDAVSVGVAHSCGLRSDGTIACWGSNADSDGNPIGQSDAPEGTFVAPFLRAPITPAR